MAIRRIHRTVIIEYVTDRADGDLGGMSFDAGNTISDTFAVVETVTMQQALIESLVDAGMSASDAQATVARQEAENTP